MQEEEGNNPVDGQGRGDRDSGIVGGYLLLGPGKHKVLITDKGGAVMYPDGDVCESDGDGDNNVPATDRGRGSGSGVG